MSNTQCQSCHSSRFHSFAVDHPDWGQWPYDQTNQIAFNHSSHSLRHFPSKLDDAGKAIQFQCNQCHPASDQGDFVRTTSYETACAQCHDASLKQQTSNRLDLFVLPSLLSPSPQLQASWPAAATGYYDGKVGPLARLLLEQSPSLKMALASLPAGGDIAQVNPQEAAQRQAAETVAIAIRDQLSAIAFKGPLPPSLVWELIRLRCERFCETSRRSYSRQPMIAGSPGWRSVHGTTKRRFVPPQPRQAKMMICLANQTLHRRNRQLFHHKAAHAIVSRNDTIPCSHNLMVVGSSTIFALPFPIEGMDTRTRY